MAKPKSNEIIVGLDIGTTKIACIAGEVTDDGIDIIGIGTAPSRAQAVQETADGQRGRRGRVARRIEGSAVEQDDGLLEPVQREDFVAAAQELHGAARPDGMHGDHRGGGAGAPALESPEQLQEQQQQREDDDQAADQFQPGQAADGGLDGQEGHGSACARHLRSAS